MDSRGLVTGFSRIRQAPSGLARATKLFLGRSDDVCLRFHKTGVATHFLSNRAHIDNRLRRVSNNSAFLFVILVVCVSVLGFASFLRFAEIATFRTRNGEINGENILGLTGLFSRGLNLC